MTDVKEQVKVSRDLARAIMFSTLYDVPDSELENFLRERNSEYDYKVVHSPPYSHDNLAKKVLRYNE